MELEVDNYTHISIPILQDLFLWRTCLVPCLDQSLAAPGRRHDLGQEGHVSLPKGGQQLQHLPAILPGPKELSPLFLRGPGQHTPEFTPTMQSELRLVPTQEEIPPFRVSDDWTPMFLPPLTCSMGISPQPRTDPHLPLPILLSPMQPLRCHHKRRG